MNIDALLEFGARNSDVGEPFSVVDKKDGKVRLVVGSGHVVFIIENIENQDCQLLPFLDRKELVAAFVMRDIESRACLLHGLIVCVGIQGRFPPEKYSAMWAHMLLTTGFNDPCSFPFTRLIQHVGADEWERREREVSEDEVAAFGAQKVLQLEQYNRDLERAEAHLALVEEGKMKKEDFIALYSRAPSLGIEDATRLLRTRSTPSHSNSASPPR